MNIQQETKPALAKDTQRRIGQFEQWMRSKRYSPNTVKAYTNAINNDER